MPGVRTAFLLGHHGCWLELRLWTRGKQPLRVRAGVVMSSRGIEARIDLSGNVKHYWYIMRTDPFSDRKNRLRVQELYITEPFALMAIRYTGPNALMTIQKLPAAPAQNTARSPNRGMDLQRGEGQQWDTDPFTHKVHTLLYGRIVTPAMVFNAGETVRVEISLMHGECLGRKRPRAELIFQGLRKVSDSTSASDDARSITKQTP